MLFCLPFLGIAQSDRAFISSLNEEQILYDTEYQDFIEGEELNQLNTVEISLDKANNRINFTTPHSIEGVNITIKDKGEKVIIQQNNMTISKSYSITFPAQAGINIYTVILQKDNQIVVKRLEKDWM